MSPEIKKRLDSGWAIISETSLGWQLTRAKRWNGSLLRCGALLIVLGLILWSFGAGFAIWIGGIFIFCACIAYAVKSDEVLFISKEDLEKAGVERTRIEEAKRNADQIAGEQRSRQANQDLQKAAQSKAAKDAKWRRAQELP